MQKSGFKGGRSINTGGFVLSVLKQLGLVLVNAENIRHHEWVSIAAFAEVAMETVGDMSQADSGDKRKSLKFKISSMGTALSQLLHDDFTIVA